jgi:hypothetical protein
MAMQAPIMQFEECLEKRIAMGTSSPLPTLEILKDQAKRLRETLARQGTTVNHSKALELIAGQYGFRDWNTLVAKAGNGPPHREYAIGDRVSGRYLNQPFQGEIIGVETFSSGHGLYRVTFEFDEPVDVVTFDSFSAFRKRVVVTLDENGKTMAKTSNGLPHMVLS